MALASTPPVKQAEGESSSSHVQRIGLGITAAGFPSIEPKKVKELPPKQSDLSNYFDQAQLTERQRDCASLRLEYGLTVAAIAERLGITRKTVDEHLDAAERKVELARVKDSAKRKKTRFNPEG